MNRTIWGTLDQADLDCSPLVLPWRIYLALALTPNRRVRRSLWLERRLSKD